MISILRRHTVNVYSLEMTSVYSVHTHILNLLHFEDTFISFRAYYPDHEKLIGDSFYKAFGMLYVNYFWNSDFLKINNAYP